MIELSSIEPQPFFPTYIWVMDLPPETYEPLNQQLGRNLNVLTKPRPPIARPPQRARRRPKATG